MMTNDCEHCLYRFGCKVRPILTENSVCGNEFHVPEEYDENVRQQGRADAIDEFRKYLKTVIPCEMPQEIWNMGVDNTCDRMLKEQKNDCQM